MNPGHIPFYQDDPFSYTAEHVKKYKYKPEKQNIKTSFTQTYIASLILKENQEIS